MIDALKRTIELANAWLEREIENAELVLIDCGATDAEITRAIGAGGYWRQKLEAGRNEQIAMTRRWIEHGDDRLH